MRSPHSIRFRVTAAVAGAVALVLLVAGVVTVASFANRERAGLDRDLRQRAEALGGRVEARAVINLGRGDLLEGSNGQGPPAGGPLEGGRPPGAPEATPPLAAERGSFIRVLTGEGTVLLSAGDVPSAGFPAPTGLGVHTVRVRGDRWRTYVRPLRVDPTGRLQVAAELGPLDDRIARLRLRVLVISAAGLLLAIALGRWFGALALRPIERLRVAVAGVSTTRDLGRRLPAGGGTEEVDALADGVNAMLARIERSATETETALVATRRFAADVGHELRTPLTSIRANLDALTRNRTLAEPERAAILAEVASEQSRLVALLDALQTLARGDAGTALPLSEVDLAEVVDAAVVAARRRHPDVDFSLDAPEGALTIIGWPDGLRTLADNLLENAARHGREQGRVEVSLRLEGDAPLLTVDDDGPGVPADERERVFERFGRGSSTRADGSGLGLALVAQQAAFHGGGVQLTEAALGGARFTVRLPGAA